MATPPGPGQLSRDGQLFISVLEKQRNAELPLFICEKINEAINNAAEEFLAKISTATRDLLFDEFDEVKEERGLYVDWYDEEKVETTIRLFPNVLSETIDIVNGNKDGVMYPIMWPLRYGIDGIFNLKAISLIPMMAELATEFGQFTKEERGGLLVQDLYENNTLQKLLCYRKSENDDDESQHLIDETMLVGMKRLKDGDLLKKEDIREYNLLWNTFTYSLKRICKEKRFRFLSDWDPVALMTPCFSDDGNSYFPIHYSTDCEDCRWVLSVFDAGMRHYPRKLGFAFTEGKDDGSREIPYHKACEQFGEEVVKRKVLDRIMNCPETNTERFLLTVAADETICLDALYILLRREPAALQRLLLGGNKNNAHQLLPESSGKRKHDVVESDDRSSSGKRNSKQSNNNTHDTSEQG